MRVDEAAALAVLERAGIQHRGVLGGGVEGVVVALGEDTVAKVWSSRSLQDLGILRDFYASVHDARPPDASVALPLVEEVLDVDGTSITVERQLTGTPLWVADGTSPELSARDIDCMIKALAALREIPARRPFAPLPVLPGEPSFAPGRQFSLELSDLVERRFERFATSLGAACADVDAVAAATVAALRTLAPAPTTLVHGDLIAANVLRTNGHASGVIDFGFLSTAGDPAFDAAVAASCFDMWGPSAREVELQLDRAFESSLGHDPARLATYRAAYALVTACCFGTDLGEGHFAWCVRMLERPDIRDAIGV